MFEHTNNSVKTYKRSGKRRGQNQPIKIKVGQRVLISKLQKCVSLNKACRCLFAVFCRVEKGNWPAGQLSDHVYLIIQFNSSKAQ